MTYVIILAWIGYLLEVHCDLITVTVSHIEDEELRSGSSGSLKEKSPGYQILSAILIRQYLTLMRTSFASKYTLLESIINQSPQKLGV